MAWNEGRQCWGDGTPIRDYEGDGLWGADPAYRWVRVMPDIFADGVWDVSGCSRACDELPIPETLVARTRAWQQWYDDEDRKIEAPAGPEDSTDWDIAGFGAEGLAIARAMKAALPEDWTVVYHDISRWNRAIGKKPDWECAAEAA